MPEMERGLYLMRDPHGNTLFVTKPFFDAVAKFLGPDKPPGTMQVAFFNGGIAGVKGTIEMKFK